LTALMPLYAMVRAFWFILPTIMLYVTILSVARIIQRKRASSRQLFGAKKVAFAPARRKIA
jgi:hypothetical protein